jgi:glycosyltransferase involved in cell wall biosynthesis
LINDRAEAMLAHAGRDENAELPLVSIGMPVRNGAATLASTLRSILAQTYTRWELILIDDGSTDGTSSIAKQFNDPRIRLFRREESRGLACRLNEALTLSRGSYFARMDGDDICFPERLAKQVEFLDLNTTVDLLGCAAVVFDASGQLHGRIPLRVTHEEICAAPWAGFYLPHPSWMGRRSWFLQHGYDSKALRAQDQELLLRTYRSSRFSALPTVLLGYRQDGTALMRTWRSRGYFGAALCRQILRGGDWRLSYGLLLLAGKFCVDVVAVAFGAYGKSLRQRGQLVDVAVQDEWLQVWRDVTVTDEAFVLSKEQYSEIR